MTAPAPVQATRRGGPFLTQRGMTYVAFGVTPMRFAGRFDSVAAATEVAPRVRKHPGAVATPTRTE